VERTIEEGLLQYCQTNQITVIAFSPLGEGLHNKIGNTCSAK
jgi:aryl-alcohol dehydrogenase-like predicted oxidoreductase